MQKKATGEVITLDRVIAQEQKIKVIGNRVPQDFFVTSGVGESDITIHAGSFHLALKQAGIESYNIMTYSSILPGIAREVPNSYKGTHGEVMETIMAHSDVERGGDLERATAGITFGWLHDETTADRYGGLVCEYSGHGTEEFARESLHASLDELHMNGFSEEFRLVGIRTITRSIVPKKRYGTAIVSLCFVNYQVPVISEGNGDS